MSIDRARIEELWARALAAESLGESEQAELLEALAADPSLRAQLLHDERVDGALRTLGRSRKNARTFSQRFLDHVVAERDKEEFAAKVWTRLEGQGSTPPAPPPTRQAKPTRRSPRRPTGGWGDSLWVRLAAACLILGALGLWWIGSRPEADSKAVKSSPDRRPPPVAGSDKVVIPQPPDLPKPEIPDAPAVVKTPEPADPPKPPAPVKDPPIENKAVTPEPRLPSDPRKDLTVAAVAQLAEVRGSVVVVRDAAREPAQAGQMLPAGAGLEVSGPGSVAVLAFTDQTRVEFGGDTEVRDVQGSGTRGKSWVLAQGEMTAVVSKQPKGLPMIVRTPHGEARVLGTTLKLRVGSSTRLEVSEGLVELKRLIDGKTVDVPSGHYAVAAAGAEMVLKPFGLVAHWEFEDAKGLFTRDSSEKAHEAKLVGAARIPSRKGRAVSFNGKDAYIDCGSGPALKGTGPLTVTAWLRTASPQKQVVIQQRSPQAFDGEYQLKLTTGGRLHWWMMARTDQQETGLYSEKSVNDGKWHHVAASRENDGTLRIFIDGKPSGTLTAPPVLLKEMTVYVGADVRDREMYFEGEIDDVRIYERALLPLETAALAASDR